MHSYRAFGLTLYSELILPSLPPAREAGSDLEIRIGQVDPDGLPGGQPIGRFAQSKPGCVWLHVPGVARFLISDGTSITVDREPGADEQTIRLYLLGSCIGAVMHQRGRLILHGSALRFGDKAVVFAGRSGAGKSTLTAAFNLRGHDLLADDLSVLDGQGRVQPGIPHIKLWDDAAGNLGLDTAEMTRIRLQVDKYAYRVEGRFCSDPLPLAAVYILHTHNRPDVLLKPVAGMDKLAPLRNNTFRCQQIKGLGLQAQHLQLCSRLANRVHIAHITRPQVGCSLEEIMDRVRADLRAVLPADPEKASRPILETA